MTAFLDFFLPDALPENSGQRRKARLTLSITLLIIGACLAYTGAHYRWEFWSGIPVLLGSAALLTGVPIALRQGASPSLMAKGTAVVMLGLITLLTIRSGGTASTSAPWFMVAPLIGLLLAEQWFAVLLTVVSIAELSVIYGLELSGYAFPTPMPESMAGESLFFSYVGLITVVLLIARVFKQEQSRALRRAESAVEDAKAQKQETEEMAERLKQQKDSVEEQVEEATRELQAQKEALASHTSEMLDAMNRFADGDLSVRVDTDRDDEIGDLFDGFNRAVESVRQTLVSVRDAAEGTARTTEEISASSEQMATAAEQQSAQAEEVAAAVEQMNQTISENARSVQRAAEATRDATQQAERSGEIVAEATQQIRQIAEGAQATADTIESVGDSSAEILQIVDTIDQIAGQTNLLALHAAITAARRGGQAAGPHGGGPWGPGRAGNWRRGPTRPRPKSNRWFRGQPARSRTRLAPPARAASGPRRGWSWPARRTAPWTTWPPPSTAPSRRPTRLRPPPRSSPPPATRSPGACSPSRRRPGSRRPASRRSPIRRTTWRRPSSACGRASKSLSLDGPPARARPPAPPILLTLRRTGPTTPPPPVHTPTRHAPR